MWLGFRRYYTGRGAFMSPPVLQEYSYCYLSFYYILKYNGHASLTVFIEDDSGKNITALWNAEEAVNNWEKKVLKLPTTLSNYSVVFVGYFDYGYHYVVIDDIKFWYCNSCKFLCLFVLFSVFLFSFSCCCYFFFLRYSKLKNDTTLNSSLFLAPNNHVFMRPP